MSGTAGRTATAIFLFAITAYFALQVVLRLVLGGAYETDEAEMLVMTPGLRLGYGPQLPLYNWLQLGLFDLLGRSLAALSLLKNGLLWLTFLLVFLGVRLWRPAGVAALGALSLFLVPDIAWEAQRATTHSNMLIATSAATLAAFLWAMRSGGWPAWIALGLAVGLGGLSKYNFFLVPVGLLVAGLTLAPFRARILTRRALIVPAIAAAILAGPYGWMVQNRDLAFSSVGKLRLETDGARAALPDGLVMLPGGMLSLLALPLLVAALAWAFGRRRAEPDPVGPLPALLLRAGAVVAVLMALGVWLAQAGTVTARWLLPLAFLAAPGLFLALAPRIGPAARRGIFAAAAVFAVLVCAGLTYDRFKEGARRDVDFTGLPAHLAAIEGAEGVPVIAEFYTAGNLAAAEPDRRIAPYLPVAAHRFAGGPVLFLMRETVPRDLAAGLAQAGWPPGTEPEVLAEGDFTLPYRHSEAEMPFRYVLARTPDLP
ncbi:hypothetical protein BYZ73_11380 [Rhodovulum viride]|uniref:Glycosyltransferase RgtA/B/C/D-like domain-containing protein n=1 Tax=Rhodovulum viride TaxID=1231134 RepID=A0ABX9DIQ0_9RHOB|nr:glycosyltransferase family 39 protein [Rhodovulum viride]RAP41271.1 hypothetical protein BYZ73_11380 [Rhodovulum viride]